jgi:hypothetical protein
VLVATDQSNGAAFWCHSINWNKGALEAEELTRSGQWRGNLLALRRSPFRGQVTCRGPARGRPGSCRAVGNGAETFWCSARSRASSRDASQSGERGKLHCAAGESVHEVSLQLPDLPAVALMAVLMRGVGQPRALQVVFAAVLLVATAQGTCVPCATAPRAQSFRAPYPRFSAPPPPLSSSSLSPHSYWCDDAAASC